eukprot:scaffold17988_cov136-Isochrysis_galbana.AAC.3
MQSYGPNLRLARSKDPLLPPPPPGGILVLGADALRRSCASAARVRKSALSIQSALDRPARAMRSFSALSDSVVRSSSSLDMFCTLLQPRRLMLPTERHRRRVRRVHLSYGLK